MSVFRLKGSQFYYFDFQFRNQRFHGTTRATSRREAEAFERAERDRVKASAKGPANAVSLRLDDVAGRYWNEVGQYHAGAENTWRDIERLVDYFGPSTMLNEITDSEVATLVAWRRGHQINRSAKKKIDAPFISNATVNRSTTEVLKKLFTRLKTAHKVPFPNEPNWKAHILPEADERVREVASHEREALEENRRDDYGPILDFSHASGLRLTECLLKWDEVKFDVGRIIKKGKGKKNISVPITSRIAAILKSQKANHAAFVFTYVAKRTEKGRVKGQRYPITRSGLKTIWRRLRKKSGVVDLRFHDLRHDLATKLLRQTGNLKLVQKALNHADIKTTMRYAHVLDSEVADALETLSQSPKDSPKGGGK